MLVLPLLSTAWTANVWLPEASPEYVFVVGVVHAAMAPESSRHWFEPPDGGALKLNAALVALVGFAGPELITGSAGPEAAIATAAATASAMSRVAAIATLFAALLLNRPHMRSMRPLPVVDADGLGEGERAPAPAPPAEVALASW